MQNGYSLLSGAKSKVTYLIDPLDQDEICAFLTGRGRLSPSLYFRSRKRYNNENRLSCSLDNKLCKYNNGA